MPHADFVHLRVHSAYSLSEGAIKVKELVGLCKSDQMPAVAVTDTGNLFGALEFATAAADAGVQPILGCQVWVRHEGEAMRQANSAKSKVRSCVEHVFAAQKDRMDLFIRTIGIARATTKIGMANLVYNIKRLLFLEKKPAMA